MSELKNKEKRKAIRIALLETKSWLVSFDRTEELIDISESGAFIKSDFPPNPDEKHMISSIVFNLPGDLGRFNVPCRVVRINWTEVKKGKNKRLKGYAVAWGDMSPSTFKILESYLVYIRNKQIITVSQRIIQEFFGSNTPPTIGA